MILSAFDLIGLVGVLVTLVAYGLTVGGVLSATAPPALLANFTGSCLVLISLSHDFNLSAAIVEGAWVMIALGGLMRWAWARR